MKIVSVILARGGSKGIPNKNIVDIQGKPMIGYVIESSLKSKVQETWVSTDCEQIKKTSLSYGAQVIDRPKKISRDFSKSEDALIHFAENILFDILVYFCAMYRLYPRNICKPPYFFLLLHFLLHKVSKILSI